ncbi:acyltransferase family protein [Dyella sedimenti]|uniref:acyltransferase family protein n=1 Tax=Dyella sedimenti TaxID=2919947 RepID=UPI001FAA8064|nr:acyltransferase [Dyella sedimenti]
MQRANNFDALRLIAASAVIFGHAHPLTASPDLGLLGNSVQATAVKIFFVISGYLIYTSWDLQPNWLAYLRKRALRIFPALIVICLLTIFIAGPLLTEIPVLQYFGYRHTYFYMANAFLYPVYDLPGVFGSNQYPVAVNGSLWSLPVEFSMYLLLPVIWILQQKTRLRALFPAFTLLLCATSIWFVRVDQPQKHPVFYGTDLISLLDVAPFFFLGATARHLRLEKYLEPGFGLFLVIAFALIQPSSRIAAEVSLYLLVPYVTLALALASNKLLSQAGHFGDFSYGIYLYGFLFQQIVDALSHGRLGPWGNTLLSLPPTVALAVLSWHFVEKPMLSLKPKKSLYKENFSLMESSS